MQSRQKGLLSRGAATRRLPMRHGLTSVLTAVLLSLSAPPASAQPPALPRTSDGKPNLQGIWQVLNTAAWDIQDHAAGVGVPTGQAVVVATEGPSTPYALAARRLDVASPVQPKPP